MKSRHPISHAFGLRLIRLAVVLLICKVVAGIVWNYRHYIPPDFSSDFLRGRQTYFFHGYHVAFFAHIASGPVSIALGLVLLSDHFRRRWPRAHRIVGRVQVANVLLLVAPSGLWMSSRAESGWIAGLAFALLAMATAGTVVLGWRAAVQRRFAVHQDWMKRSFVLLSSAIVLRLMAGLFIVFEIDGDWTYPLTAWLCWIMPLSAYEGLRRATCVKLPE